MATAYDILVPCEPSPWLQHGYSMKITYVDLTFEYSYCIPGQKYLQSPGMSCHA